MSDYSSPFNSFSKINPDLHLEYLLDNKHYEAAILEFIYFNMDYKKNILHVSCGVVKGFSTGLKLSERYVQKCIKSLVDKGPIKRLDKYNIHVDPFYANKQTRIKNNLGFVSSVIKKRDIKVLNMITALNKMAPRVPVPISKKATEMKRLLDIIESQQESIANFAQAFINLTTEEKEALPPALRLIAKNGELVK